MKRVVASILSAAMILSTFGNVTYAKGLKSEVTETKTYPQVQSYTTEKSG